MTYEAALHASGCITELGGLTAPLVLILSTFLACATHVVIGMLTKTMLRVVTPRLVTVMGKVPAGDDMVFESLCGEVETVCLVQIHKVGNEGKVLGAGRPLEARVVAVGTIDGDPGGKCGTRSALVVLEGPGALKLVDERQARILQHGEGHAILVSDGVHEDLPSTVPLAVLREMDHGLDTTFVDTSVAAHVRRRAVHRGGGFIRYPLLFGGHAAREPTSWPLCGDDG